MTTPIPNFFTNRAPWHDIYFGGVRMNCALVEINGVATEDAWQKQKSKETSGQVAVFQGTTWADFDITLEECEEGDEDEVRGLWEKLAPVPGLGTNTGTVTPPSQTKAIGSPAFTGNAGKTGSSAASSTSSATSSTDFNIPNNEPSKGPPSPGPRPPTISVQHPILAWHGITAVARKKWEGPIVTETNSIRHKITFIADKPPTPAGTGAMGPAAPSSPGSQFVGGGAATGPNGPPLSPQDVINTNAAKGAAGT